MSVLIVDDHAMFRVRARAIVESAGYRVVGEAEDAASALTQAAALHPDIVLLDIRLPDRDGFAVAEALQRELDPPAIVLTSSSDPRDLERKLRETNVLGFIPKEALSAARLQQIVGHGPGRR